MKSAGKVAVIPARGGSKRVPRKNIRDFAGKPMLAYSIEAARQSQLFDRIIVSTDDEQIAKIANYYGAETPFERPSELSNDFVGSLPVVAHAIEWLSKHISPPDYACCIYATAPFLMAQDLQKGFQLLQQTSSMFAFSVTSFDFPIQRGLRLTSSGAVEALYPEFNAMRSQDLEECFHDAGQFYWGTIEAFLNNETVFAPHSQAVVLPRYRVQDIDTEEDWQRAELMYRVLQEQKLL